MKFRINRFDPATATVDVTFTAGGVKHRRPVNACLDGEGKYDPAATRVRLAEVGEGVAVKIRRGVIG